MPFEPADGLSPDDLAGVEARVGAVYRGDPFVGASRSGRVGLVCSSFNGSVTKRLLDGALGALEAHGVTLGTVTVVWVPGAFEIPLAAERLAATGAYDAVICLGAVIRGDTPHFEYVAGECAAGVQRAMAATGVPIAFGVLTTDDVAQAVERSQPQSSAAGSTNKGPVSDKEAASNKGAEAALVALGMADLLARYMPQPAGRHAAGSSHAAERQGLDR